MIGDACHMIGDASHMIGDASHWISDAGVLKLPAELGPRAADVVGILEIDLDRRRLVVLVEEGQVIDPEEAAFELAVGAPDTLRFEIFNPFNWTNFGLPDNFLGSPTFGRCSVPTATAEPRAALPGSSVTSHASADAPSANVTVTVLFATV